MASKFLRSVRSTCGITTGYGVGLFRPRCMQTPCIRGMSSSSLMMKNSRCIPWKQDSLHFCCLNSRMPLYSLRTPRRTLVICSKRKGKKKSVKAVLKRFKITGTGKVKFWRSGRNRRQMRKNVRARKAIKRPAYCNKQQAKLIKKMMCL